MRRTCILQSREEIDSRDAALLIVFSVRFAAIIASFAPRARALIRALIYTLDSYKKGNYRRGNASLRGETRHAKLTMKELSSGKPSLRVQHI